MQGSPRIDELRQKFHENPRRYFAPLANEYRKAGDPEQAIAICRAHLAQQPQHMSGHVVYGQALYDAKRADEARTVFEKALALDPDNAVVLRQLGDIAREKGESAEARHWYSKALDLDPQDSEAAAYLAELEEPLVGVAESDAVSPPDAVEDIEVLETVEAEVEEQVVHATPSEGQGDGAEESPEPESTFVMSQDSDDGLGDTQPVPETEESQASDDGMPEPEQQPEPVEEPEPEVQPEPVEEPEPEVRPAAIHEPEPPSETDEEEEEEERAHPAAPETPWRKTPHPVESPFVTRTMAELYVKQGYTAAALDVYRQLAIQHPDDAAIRERIEELSPRTGAPEHADEPAAATGPAAAESIYMPDTDFSLSADARTGAPIDPEGRHFSDLELPRGAEIGGGAEERGAEIGGDAKEASIFGDLAGFDDSPAFGDTAASGDTPAEITKEDIWGDLGEAGAEEAFGERVAELDWTDPGFGFGASEPEAPETEPVAELEKREDETEEAEEGTGVANGARFVELPVRLGEFQTSIDEAGMASTSPHESEIAPSDIGPAAEQGQSMPVTTGESVEAEFRGDEAAAAMAAGEAAAEEPGAVTPAPEPDVEASEPQPAVEGSELEPSVETAMFAEPPEPVDEAGVVAYSPEPPRDEDLPHFTPKVPTVREFFATLGSRKPPVAGNAGAFTARAAVPDVTGQAQPQADDLPLATDAFSNLFPGEEIAEDDTRAAFALSGALSGASHNPVPEKIQTPPQPQEPVATENQTQESEEDIRRFREWLDGLADS